MQVLGWVPAGRSKANGIGAAGSSLHHSSTAEEQKLHPDGDSFPGLGIGATTAVFSVVYGVLLDPYPYKDNNRMVHVQLLDKNGAMMALLYTDGPGYKAVLQAKSVEDAFQMRNSSATITGGQLPVSVQLGRYSPNLFTFMGVPPLLGRQFTGADTANGQTTKVAVLSYLFWKKQYGASRDVLGKTIELDHTLYTIIGVAAPRFTWGDSEVYVPDVTQSDPHDFPWSLSALSRGSPCQRRRRNWSRW